MIKDIQILKTDDDIIECCQSILDFLYEGSVINNN